MQDVLDDAKQVGAQGYNGAIDFGSSDVTASVTQDKVENIEK